MSFKYDRYHYPNVLQYFAEKAIEGVVGFFFAAGVVVAFGFGATIAVSGVLWWFGSAECQDVMNKRVLYTEFSLASGCLVTMNGAMVPLSQVVPATREGRTVWVLKADVGMSK